MAAFDLEEQERVDALKDWWKENKTYIYVGFAAFIIAVAAVQGWRYYKAKQANRVAEAFAEFDKTVQAGDAKKIIDAAGKIQAEYPGSPYAAQAALTAARIAYEAMDTTAAEASLKWVAEKSASPQLQSIARLRWAAVLLDQKKYDEALKLLDDNKDDAFLSLTADLKGDIYSAQGKAAEARASYKLALDKATPRAPSRQLIQIKLDALGEAK